MRAPATPNRHGDGGHPLRPLEGAADDAREEHQRREGQHESEGRLEREIMNHAQHRTRDALHNPITPEPRVNIPAASRLG